MAFTMWIYPLRISKREGIIQTMPQKRVTLKIQGVLDPIPAGDADNPEFVDWCEANNVHPLGGGEMSRRGWCGWLKTYIRDADYMFHADTGETLLLTQAEVDTMLIE